MDKEKQKEIQQHYLELQLIDQQIKQVQKNLQFIENQLLELRVTDQSIDELANVKGGSEVLMPISNSIFVKGTITDHKELTVNIGSNIAVKKKKEDVKGLIKKQLEEVKKIQKNLLGDLQNLVVRAQILERELKKIASK